MSVENQIINKLIESYKVMREASYQSHFGHFDPKGNRGRDCPECIRANNLRDRADQIAQEAKQLYRKTLGADHDRKKDNPFCEACQETDCLVGHDSKCAMLRIYAKASKNSA